ncbi:MAG: tyrosine-type recombinase/integrase [Caulobacter sp.]|nr:tyrosine-type recombinase/integrase [Caulobacter sp.]
MLDLKAMHPNAANNRLRIIRILFAFAQERAWRPDNPAKEVKKLKVVSDGYHVWNEAEIEKFESFWPVGSRERLAFDLLLYTGQRSADVRLMTRNQISYELPDEDGKRRGTVAVRQEKTGASLIIPLHEALLESLDASKTQGLLLLQTAQNRPFSPKGFSNWICAAAKEAGLTGCTAHGLRKSAATRLADAGCSAHEIMAVTGHKTLSEVQRYTKSAEQRDKAGKAMKRLQETHRERKLSNLRQG